MNKDRVKGVVDEMAGSAKRKAGALSGNTQLEIEGMVQQVKPGARLKKWFTMQTRKPRSITRRALKWSWSAQLHRPNLPGNHSDNSHRAMRDVTLQIGFDSSSPRLGYKPGAGVELAVQTAR